MQGLFLDGVCPKCGRSCGNGGTGMMLRCSCGWTGGLCKEDVELFETFLRRAQERDAAAKSEYEQAGKE